MEEKETNIYQQTIDKWGETAQLDQMIEEMAELTLAISKYKRQFNDSLLDYQKVGVMENLYIEIADVKMMIEQMEYMFGQENIDKAYQKQMEKLKRELNN